MSIQQTVSPTRYIGRGKPRRTRKDIDLFHCSVCGGYLTGWQNTDASPYCCGQEMERVSFVPNEELDPSVQIDYKIRGSLNNNCIVVTWGKVKPVWIMLESFRGSQFFYVESSFKEVFALAGTDAYAYCDKDPCKECSFRCKRGFAIYANLPGIGIVKREVDRISTDQG